MKTMRGIFTAIILFMSGIIICQAQPLFLAKDNGDSSILATYMCCTQIEQWADMNGRNRKPALIEPRSTKIPSSHSVIFDAGETNTETFISQCSCPAQLTLYKRTIFLSASDSAVLKMHHAKTDTIKEIGIPDVYPDTIYPSLTSNQYGFVKSLAYGKIYHDTIRPQNVVGIRNDGLLEIFTCKYLVLTYSRIITDSTILFEKFEKKNPHWDIIGGPKDVINRISGLYSYQENDQYYTIGYFFVKKLYFKNRPIGNKRLN